jgi:hypothetical protein
MGNKPVVFISWWNAARYCNWLHNKVSYPNSNFIEFGAYTLNSVSFYENAMPKTTEALYWIPTENEWYKAAYYSPNKNGSSGYYNYATQSDNNPVCVTADQTGNGQPNGITQNTNYVCLSIEPTPTPTQTPTTTLTQTSTPNPTPPPTRTPTATPTNTTTPTTTPTNTTTPTKTPTITPTQTPTKTSTPTTTSTQTPTASITPTPTSTLAECTLRNVQVAIPDHMLYNQISGRRAETIKFIMAGEGCCGESNTIVINVPSRTPTQTPTPTVTPTKILRRHKHLQDQQLQPQRLLQQIHQHQIQHQAPTLLILCGQQYITEQSMEIHGLYQIIIEELDIM